MKKAKHLYDIIRTGIGDNEEQTQEFIKEFDISLCSFETEYNQSFLQKCLSHSKKYDIAKFLIEQNCNLNYQDNEGFTALIYLICSYNDENTVIYDELTRLIIEKGINPYHKNNVSKSVYDLVKEYDIDEITSVFNKYIK